MDCKNETSLSRLPDDYRVTFGILMAVLAFISTIENLIVLFVLLKFTVLHTTSNKILRSLAFANFLTGLVVCPIHSVQLLNEKALTNCLLNSARRFLSALLLGAAAFTLAFISYDRCLHLLKLRNYSLRTRTLYLVLTLCWLVPVIFPLLRFADNREQVYSSIVAVFGALIMIAIVISYAGLLYALRRHSMISFNAQMQKRKLRNERNAGKTVIIIVVFCFLVMLPITVHFGITAGADFSPQTLSKSYIIVIFLALTNAAVNPLIYCYRTASLRRYILIALGMRSKDDTNPTSSSYRKRDGVSFSDSNTIKPSVSLRNPYTIS